MTLLFAVAYIFFFTYHSIRRFAPCFLAVSGDMPYGDARVRRSARVSLGYIAGAFVSAAAWAVVIAETLAVMYGG